MAFCSFAQEFALFDSTPVENLFIEEYMRSAPGDFVKVYLYLLRQCYHPDPTGADLASVAQALHMEEDTVTHALQYWERQGILVQKADGVELRNLKAAMTRGDGADASLYRYKEFNQHLQMLFGTRLLSPQDLSRVYDWIDVLRLPEDVVILLVQYCLRLKGPKVSMAYIDKMAQVWAKAEIRTVDDADAFIAEREAANPGARRVLRHLGISRNPSADEVAMFMKWTGEWQFALEAVLAACRETTRAQTPTMAYVDRVLQSYRANGIRTVGDIEEYQARRDMEAADAVPVREALFELGSRETVTAAHTALYRKWLEDWGFEKNVVMTACRHCAKRGKHNFEAVDQLLAQWAQYGLKTEQDMDAYMAHVQQLNEELRAVFARAGEDRAPTAADRRLYEKWMEQWQMPFELVLLAAEYSVAASRRMACMDKLLSQWKEKNILTLEAAKAEHAAHNASGMSFGGAKTAVPQKGQQFAQRENNPDAYDALFEHF